MIFNFWYGHHSQFSLGRLADTVLPISHGLAEAGHRVIGFGTALQPAPVVNLLVEFFPVEALIDFLVQFRAKFGDNFVLGVLCTEDVDDATKMLYELAPRRPNLLRLLPIVDFVWTLTPQVEFYESIVGPGKVALVKYGYTERWLERAMLSDAAQRDVDVVLYGDQYDNGSPRHAAILDGLKRQGLVCVFDYEVGYPGYVTDDVMRRAKVSLDIRSRPEVRFLSQPRIVRALHSGTLVLAEPYDTSSLAELYRYVETSAYERIEERTLEIVRSNSAVDLGRAALARFKAETSMRDNMMQALSLPAFDRVRT